jgi:adenylate cyclase
VQPRILVVDDTPQNIRLMEAVLTPRGYAVAGATSGEEALTKTATEQPDLVLLDVVMPGMNGLEVCRRLRAESATKFLPVIMITASGDREKINALEAGADDFVHKPFDHAELLARVSSLLRIKTYYDTIERQALELANWNHTLEERVAEQLTQLERLSRLKGFLAPQVAEVLISAEGEALLESHRRQIAVISCRIAGFTQLAETSAPEEAIAVLAAYHESLGGVIFDFEGTVGPLVEDRITVVFNDPLPIDDPAGRAVRAAVAMRERMQQLLGTWRKSGYALEFGVGIDMGYATLGTVVFAGRTDYGAIGTVVHVAARLCEAAGDGEILVSQRVQLAADDAAQTSSRGEHMLAGFTKPVSVFAVERVRDGSAVAAQPTRYDSGGSAGPLTEREREVVELIVRGYTNRQIAGELVIAEGTAVRHVANILNKLELNTRAQVAVWAVERAHRH